MPEFDPHFGNAFNSKTARVIERKCDIVDTPAESSISQLEGDSWHEKNDMWSLYQVGFLEKKMGYIVDNKRLNFQQKSFTFSCNFSLFREK